jgi:hypothetical protein
MGKVAFFHMTITLDIGEQPSWSAVAMPDEEETAAADWSPYFGTNNGGVQPPSFRRLVPAALLPPADEDVPDNEDDIAEDEGGGGRIQRSLDSLQALADSLTSIGQVQRISKRASKTCRICTSHLKAVAGFWRITYCHNLTFEVGVSACTNK